MESVRSTAATVVQVGDHTYTMPVNTWVRGVGKRYKTNAPDSDFTYVFEFLEHEDDEDWVVGSSEQSPLRSPFAVGDLVQVTLAIGDYHIMHLPGLIVEEAWEYERPSDGRRSLSHNVYYEWGKETRSAFCFLWNIHPCS